MSKTYYKVVNNNLESITASRWPIWESSICWNDYIIQYKKNEWVYPNIPKTDLMVFSNYKDAAKFARYCQNPVIYKCKVKSPKKYGIFSSNLAYLPEEVQELLTLKSKKIKYTDKINVGLIPDGTVFCSAVKLIERV